MLNIGGNFLQLSGATTIPTNTTVSTQAAAGINNNTTVTAASPSSAAAAATNSASPSAQMQTVSVPQTTIGVGGSNIVMVATSWLLSSWAKSLTRNFFSVVIFPISRCRSLALEASRRFNVFPCPTPSCWRRSLCTSTPSSTTGF